MQVLIRKAHIIDPTSAYHGQILDILLKNGRIDAIGKDLSASGAMEIAQEGLHVSPGWIDMVARFGEPGHEQKETLRSGAFAAARGGFTAIGLMPSTHPPRDHKSTIEWLRQNTAELPVKIYPYGTLTAGREGVDMAELLDMHEGGAVAFSDDRRPVENPKLFELILQYLKGFNGLAIHFADTPRISGKGIMHEGNMSAWLGLKGIPAYAEEMAIDRDLHILEYTGSRLHFPLVTTPESLRKIRTAQEKGLEVTAGIAPHYFWFTDKSLEQFESIHKVKPPYRGADEKTALLDGIKSGTITVLCSDHSPEDQESKSCELEYAAFGVSAIETVFGAAWAELENHIALENLIAMLTTNPRQILGIRQPVIAAGEEAELTVFSPQTEWVLKRSVSQGVNQPFTGKTLKGKVWGTYVKGQWHGEAG